MKNRFECYIAKWHMIVQWEPLNLITLWSVSYQKWIRQAAYNINRDYINWLSLHYNTLWSGHERRMIIRWTFHSRDVLSLNYLCELWIESFFGELDLSSSFVKCFWTEISTSPMIAGRRTLKPFLWNHLIALYVLGRYNFNVQFCNRNTSNCHFNCLAKNRPSYFSFNYVT